MKKMVKLALKFISAHDIDMKKNYQIYRKVLIAANTRRRTDAPYLDDSVVLADRLVPIRVFHPPKKRSRQVILFFHGGGWVTGNIDTYTNICAYMAKQTTSCVISVDYRLAPEYPCPVGLQDCYDVAKELSLHPYLIPCKEKDLILAGDSAGGNLAAAVALMARDLGEFHVGRQILLYPAMYYTHNEESPYNSVKENGTDYFLTAKRLSDYMDLYVPKKEDRINPYVAPLLADNFSNLPVTLIITAEYDLLRDEGEDYGRQLKKAKIPTLIRRMPGAIHGFLSLPRTAPVQHQCYQIINRFLNQTKERDVT